MSGEQTTDSVLITKLHRSRVDGDHVQRTHLLKILGQRGQKPLTLVSVPAGYSKTTLISSWRESGKPSPLKDVYFGEQLVHTRNPFDAFTAGVRTIWREGKRK